MKVEDLIEKLKEMPPEMNVSIFDWRKNLFVGGGDPVSNGIMAVEDVEVVPDDETFEMMKEDGDDDVRQWVAIHYENDDYTEDANPARNTMIAEHFGHEGPMKPIEEIKVPGCIELAKKEPDEIRDCKDGFVVILNLKNGLSYTGVYKGMSDTQKILIESVDTGCKSEFKVNWLSDYYEQA